MRRPSVLPHAGTANCGTVSQLSNQSLFTLAEMGEPGSVPHAAASRERLRREIMTVDNIQYHETSDRLLEIAKHINPNDPTLETPFVVAIYSAYLAGFASIPMCFHYATAAKFNDLFVTIDPPEVGAADTMLEVGMWSWAWMEPLTGTLSFFLLCLDFARGQRLSIGGKTNIHTLMEHQAAKILKEFPQYDANLVAKYGYVLAVIDDEVDSIRREQARIMKIYRARSP